MRIVKVFWGLDASLAYARHFPAINWLTSYSLYLDTLRGWCDENLGRSFMLNRGRAMALLQKEAELQEIVKLVGQDALSPTDNLTLESAKMIREDFFAAERLPRKRPVFVVRPAGTAAGADPAVQGSLRRGDRARRGYLEALRHRGQSRHRPCEDRPGGKLPGRLRADRSRHGTADRRSGKGG